MPLSGDKRKFENLTIPNGITLIGLVLALFGILLLSKEKLASAIILLTLCDVFDTLDGYIARKFKMYSPLGADLDELVDVVAWLMPPFVIAVMLGNFLVILFAVFFVSCGVFRLARYNVEQHLKGYTKGLQASIAAHMIYLALIIDAPLLVIQTLYLVLGLLMVSTFVLKIRFSFITTGILMLVNISVAVHAL